MFKKGKNKGDNEDQAVDEEQDKAIEAHLTELESARFLGHLMAERYDAIVKYSKLKSIVIGFLSIMLLASVVAAGAGWSRTPEIKYFYLTEDGVAIKVDPLNEPNRSSQVRAQFVSRAFIDLFDFSYLKVGDHFDRIAPDYMSNRGRKALMTALSSVGLIEEMKEKYEIATLIPEGHPTVFGEGISPRLNVYVWAYHMPIRIRLDGPSGVRYKTAVARFTLARVPPHIHVRGLLIDNIQLLTPEQAKLFLEGGEPDNSKGGR